MSARHRSTTELLDLVFGDEEAPRRRTRITLPPDHWFCHACDSHCTPRDFAYASLRWRPLGRHIVHLPYEWRHRYQDDRLEVEEQRRGTAPLGGQVSRPGRALT